MILYEYECTMCNHQFEEMRNIQDRHFAQCPKCNGGSKQIIKHYRNQDWFKPGYWEDFGDAPVYVESRSHLKELCFKHGVHSRALGIIDDRRGS